MPRRRLLTAAFAWVAAVVVARGAVALPERCPAVSPRTLRAAATEAVGWFERNQLSDGRWVYRYDRATGTVDEGLQQVRHAGVTMSLYQANAAGLDQALSVADAGARWALDRLTRHDGWAAVAPGGPVRTGATALLVAGLATRQATTGDDRHDDVLAELGRFLLAMTEPSGAVIDEWDPVTEHKVAGSYSPFATGEVAYALAWLATIQPDEPEWAAGSRAVLGYLAAHRDRAEGRFPPISDHWAALALDQLATAGVALDRTELEFGRRLAGLFGLQVRYESQRTDSGLNRWVQRGPRALGAAVGTLGEGLSALSRLARTESAFDDLRAPMRDRLACGTGLLVDRQVDAREAARAPDPERARGAWFRFDVTQQDDQQHSLSALLAAADVLDEGGGRGGPSRDDSVPRLVWLAVIAVAALNPLRARRLAEDVDRRHLSIGALAGGVALGAVAALAGPLLGSIDVSPPTALVAAGFVLAASAVVDLVRSSVTPMSSGAGSGALVPSLFPAVLRPAVALVVAAVAADAGVAAGLVASAAVAGSVVLLARWRQPTGRLAEPVTRGIAALAVFGAVDLVVHGVLNV